MINKNHTNTNDQLCMYLGQGMVSIYLNPVPEPLASKVKPWLSMDSTLGLLVSILGLLVSTGGYWLAYWGYR